MLNRCFEFAMILEQWWYHEYLLSDNWNSLYFMKVFVEINSIDLIFNIILYLILFNIICALVSYVLWSSINWNKRSLKKIYNIV